MMKKYKWSLILVLGIIAGAFFVYDHFYQRGIRAVADLSERELASLEAFQGASQVKSASLEELAREAGDLAAKRKAAFARFRELCGSNI